MKNKRPAHNPEMVRLSEVCARLGVHINTGYHWIAAGTFPIEVRRMGALWACRADDVERYFGKAS